MAVLSYMFSRLYRYSVKISSVLFLLLRWPAGCHSVHRTYKAAYSGQMSLLCFPQWKSPLYPHPLPQSVYLQQNKSESVRKHLTHSPEIQNCNLHSRFRWLLSEKALRNFPEWSDNDLFPEVPLPAVPVLRLPLEDSACNGHFSVLLPACHRSYL